MREDGGLVYIILPTSVFQGRTVELVDTAMAPLHRYYDC